MYVICYSVAMKSTSILEKLAAEQLVTIKEVAQASAYTISGCPQTASRGHQRSNYFSGIPSLGKQHIEMLEPNKTNALQDIKLKRIQKRDVSKHYPGWQIYLLRDICNHTSTSYNRRCQNNVNHNCKNSWNSCNNCISCNKKVIIIAMPGNPMMGKCEACKLKQTITSSEANWYIRILVQDRSAFNEKLQ